jgi:hypothetical protein
MADGHMDYSGTPLWKKLGIAPGARVRLLSPPAGLDTALTAIAPLPDGVTLVRRAAQDLDVIVLFVTRANDLSRRFGPLVEQVATDGRLWVAWPKKVSKTETDVDFGVVQAAGLAAGLVDNKSAAVTEVFQGLQFVRRRADRAR